ncbi:PD-(D/E)XK motif protein [Thalassovita taeanensis]|uniref:Putative PD-(D/E)XK family member n=1 Tax=Thalassovita taeanensis TaxID=657014 RepID=A0A1H9FB53_9RHOB|nr:PD-(D/E)XK motif protein [Thalassovita taeanensis]SEQ35150.1 Putative PD-(D/E)XK family member [Thalassovita taeanensis]
MLFDKYNGLIARFPDECDHLFGQDVDGRSDLWFSIDANGHPSLLFETTKGEEQPDLKLKYVEVEFARRCEIAMEGGRSQVGTFTVVSFKDDDADLVRIFLRLLEEAFLAEKGPHSSQEIRSKIITLAEIFSRLETSVKDVIGLWGELHVIRRSHDPIKVARAWCLAKSAQFDFLGESHVLEVKATTKARRLHRFSMEQVRPSSGLNSYICSVLLAELPSGMTVGELMDEVLELIEDVDDRSRLFHQCLKKGGKDIYASALPLSVFPDGASLAVFRASTIPVPQVDESAPIYNVRFDADLSDAVALSREDAEHVLSL